MAIHNYELRILGVHMDEFTENVLHFQGNGVDPTDTYMGGQSLVNGWIATVETAFLAAMPSTFQIRGYQAKDLATPFSPVYRSFYPAGAKTGTSGSLGQSLQFCPCLLLVPAMGFKSLGKIFLPAVPLGSYTNNKPSSSYQTIITTLVTALLTAFTNAGIAWALLVLSKKLGTASVVQSANLAAKPGFQKRRRSPTGAN